METKYRNMWGHRKRSKMKARTVPLLQPKAGAKYNTSLSLQHIAGIFTFFWKRHWSLQFLFFLQWATFTIIFQYTHQRPRDLQPCSQGSLPPVPREREREREWASERCWLVLVTWLQNKINSEGGVLCLSIILSGSFSLFTEWSQEQDRFANPTTTTEIWEISA